MRSAARLADSGSGPLPIADGTVITLTAVTGCSLADDVNGNGCYLCRGGSLRFQLLVPEPGNVRVTMDAGSGQADLVFTAESS